MLSGWEVNDRTSDRLLLGSKDMNGGKGFQKGKHNFAVQTSEHSVCLRSAINMQRELEHSVISGKSAR